MNGGSQPPDKRKAGGHGPTLADQVEHLKLLPTPVRGDSTGGNSRNDWNRQGALALPEVVDSLKLLPTPTGRDSKGIDGHSARQGSQVLPGVVEALLPTPRTTRGGSATETVVALWDGRVVDWGEYEPAVARWAQLFAPVPAPLEPGKTRPRLACEFSEWMMGLPAGWVTRVPVPRTVKLKAIGNGVVPQQMELGIRLLLARMKEMI